MSAYVAIHPRDDGPAKQAASWGVALSHIFSAHGHSRLTLVDDTTPADGPHIVAALGLPATLILYFGHGDDDRWLTSNTMTVDRSTIGQATTKAVISIACKTSRTLGPEAITAGVRSWFGFSFQIPVIAPLHHRDPIGEALVQGLHCLAQGHDMACAKDQLNIRLEDMVRELESGSLSSHPASNVALFLVECLRNHIVLNGDSSFQPL